MATTHCDYPFATPEQASGAISTILEVLTNNTHGHTTDEVARCFVALTSFGVSQVVTPVPKGSRQDKAAITSTVAAMSDEEKLEKLREAKHAIDGTSRQAIGAFNWAILLELVYQLVKEWLNTQ